MEWMVNSISTCACGVSGVLGVSGQSWNFKGSLCGSTTSIKATMYLSLQFKQRPFAHRSWASACIRRHGADGWGRVGESKGEWVGAWVVMEGE
ncbi:unnamed protein product [Prunus armeniaca]|uniref:Uncharacterized protein n=1 Tax=Prunus armeniaca TaxID=36596 RepID=A0A6J5XR59_PRUAR|nr:unnamed protein product [Prunus armeniaca]